MAIPETQLETWSCLGTTESAAVLYERIKNVLRNDNFLKNLNPEIFLQGSYRNSTNIRGDSDVDVVVMLANPHIPEYGKLDDHTRRIVEGQFVPATYSYTEFRRDVSNALCNAFPAHNVTEGGKSIKIPRTSNNIPADVVPCFEYRLYQPPQTLLGSVSYVDGIWLKDVQSGRLAISYPKKSYENGVTKHGRTNLLYKPTVRIFKNARGWMEDNGLIQIGSASSHNIECLLYNVPDHKFSGSYADTFVNVLSWLNDADLTSFICQNGIQSLFDPERWTQQSARTYIRALIHIWNNWK